MDSDDNELIGHPPTETSPSSDSGVVVETVFDDDDDDDDIYHMDDDASLGEMSNYDVDPDSKPTERVLLTEEHCRVIWKPAAATALLRVCGMQIKGCTHGHKALLAIPTNVSLVGHYNALPPTRRNYLGSVDGEAGTLVPPAVIEQEQKARTETNHAAASSRTLFSPQLSKSYADEPYEPYTSAATVDGAIRKPTPGETIKRERKNLSFLVSPYARLTCNPG
jgi:hypothetical protein